MLTQNQVLEYQGNPITFDLCGSSRMINATEMARSFNRKPAHFLRSTQTQVFIMALITSQVANSQLGYQDIVKVVHGGDNAGTWMHEKLALKFAAWLSPRFEVWVFDRIQELLLQGHVAIRPTENTDQTERIEALERRLHDVELNMFKSLHHFACAFWEKEIVDEARRTAPHDMAAIHRYTASFTASVKKATENIH